MERLSQNREEIRKANQAIRRVISRAKRALAGRPNFSVDDIRIASDEVGRIAKIAPQIAECCKNDAHLDADLKEYKAALAELHTDLERLRFMWLSKQAGLAAERVRIEQVKLWASALEQTR